ncbi:MULTISPECIES: HAD hydrolase-like protein [Pumilibacter]|uniref:HAD hydrolase-like protein n=1 Tax=Pumilibacter TaxID=2941493 RepID=UPI002040889F|nr:MULTISPECIES: HAD hydrolase-like protein [Pumilibacter]
MNIKVDNIFVDYFDTIAFRNIHPDKTKELWAQRMARAVDYSVLPDQLLKYRLSSEKMLAMWVENGQYSYNELMQSIYNKIERHTHGYAITKDEFINIAKNIEEEIECESQYPNIKIIDFLRQAKLSGKRVYLVSDFYLGKDSYSKFFEKLGINDLFDKIYISCDCKASKANGSLYRFIMEQETIAAYDIIMIGDTKSSDYLVPKQMGISVKYIPNKQQKKMYKNQVKQSNKKRAIRISNKRSSWSNYSYSLYLFCDRLYVECKQKNVNKLFFLAREGKFLKLLFDRYLQTKKDGISTAYLYVSRNSTFIASMQDLSAETFDVLFRQYNKFSIRSFLKALCFTDSEIETISCDNKDEIIIDFQKSSTFEKLKSDDTFCDIYDRKRMEQKNNFIKHLKNVGYSEGDNINIVDVGWKGSMQDNIHRIMGHGISINGYYLGLVGQGNLSSDNDKIGLLFDWATNRSIAHSDVYLYEYILYEMILSADHGKTIGYDDNGQPIIKDDEDVQAYKRYVGKIQNGILKKFSEICKLYDGDILINNDINIFEKIHLRLFKHMSFNEINTWYNLLVLHRDSFLGLNCNEYSRISFLIKKKVKPYIRLKQYVLRSI